MSEVVKCAYRRICKGVCNTSSCIRDSKTEEEYWTDVQDAVIARATLDTIRHLVSTCESFEIKDLKKWLEI